MEHVPLENVFFLLTVAFGINEKEANYYVTFLVNVNWIVWNMTMRETLQSKYR